MKPAQCADIGYTIRRCFLMIAIVLQGASGVAQNIFSSPYSVYGVGILNDRSASLNRSLGGTGIAVRDEYNLNHVNPASYGSIVSPVSHVFEIGTYVEMNRYKTQSLGESKSHGGITNLSYWFKFKPWWSASLGLSPFSSVSYAISTQKDLSVAPDAGYLYKGSGNITQLYFGNGFDLQKNLSVGFNVSYLFGTITRSESITSATTANALTLENKMFTNKLNLDFGVQYKIPLGKRSLVVGAVYDNGLSLRGKSKVVLVDETYDTLTTADGEHTRYKLPQHAGVGLSFNGKRSLLAADLKFTNWNSASYPQTEADFQDTWKLSMGYAYKGNDNALSYLGLIGFRAGFHLQEYHLRFDGNSMTTWGTSLGLSLPVLDGKSSINLVYSYDQLGTLRNDLILQRSQKIMVDIVIRDLWGIKRKID